MDKALCSTLLLLNTFVLLLNSSHEARKHPDIAKKISISSTLDEKRKQDVLDFFKTVYNIHNNDTYLSNIMNYKLWLWAGSIYGEVQLDQTTCTQIESDLDKCPLKTDLRRGKDKQGRVIYVNLNPEEHTCNKFLSKVANCPFNEQADQQKLAPFHYIIKVNTNDHMEESIPDYVESSFVNRINIKLINLSSSKIFRQRKKAATLFAKISQEQSLGHVLTLISSENS
ncbi:cystatin-related protein 1-like [Peromyscus californicus insignis]|uniref:cystatin-related protein 1-like n=1 Tax=Peromyscus californicus insignis TaxID=564181 RepID=UPI0022A66DB6|nr:cystatin-related protein 1-like [Peromyscus californicus insignis]